MNWLQLPIYTAGILAAVQVIYTVKNRRIMKTDNSGKVRKRCKRVLSRRPKKDRFLDKTKFRFPEVDTKDGFVVIDSDLSRHMIPIETFYGNPTGIRKGEYDNHAPFNNNVIITNISLPLIPCQLSIQEIDPFLTFNEPSALDLLNYTGDWLKDEVRECARSALPLAPMTTILTDCCGLPTDHILFVVPPKDKQSNLYRCYKNCLTEAWYVHRAQEIGLPLLSLDNPFDKCQVISMLLRAVRDFLESIRGDTIPKIIIQVIDDPDVKGAFRSSGPIYFPPRNANIPESCSAQEMPPLEIVTSDPEPWRPPKRPKVSVSMPEMVNPLVMA